MSAKDPIEELFRENQHGLDEKPRDLIWGRIEERLDEKQLAKKKNNWWKYGAVASILVGLTISIWAILNNPNDFNSEISAPQIVLEEPIEVNEENASEILDKLEENKQSVVVREKKESAPDVIENEMENIPKPISLKVPESKMKSEPVYDIAPMEEISAVPAMESSKKLEEGEVVVFRGENPEKKEGNYVLQSKSKSQKYEKEDTRRLGNMADSSGTYGYEKSTLDSIIVNQFYVKTSISDIQYKLKSTKNDSLIYSNSTINYPSEIIFMQINKDIKVEFKGDKSYKNSQESKEIQKYVNENKDWIFNTIDID